MTHIFDGSDHDGWCAACGKARTDHKPSALRRCVSCFEPYVTPADTPFGGRCEPCVQEDRWPADWTEAWYRSLRIQRELREIQKAKAS
jgi:hypothetical protein